MRITTIASICIAITACATPADKLEFSGSSDQALVLLEIEPAVIETRIALYRLAGPSGNGRSFSDALKSKTIQLPKREDRSFVFEKVGPGFYAISKITQQDNWSLCFLKETVWFEVKAGHVELIGSFNPNPHIAQLQLIVSSLGHNLSLGVEQVYFENILPPTLSTASEQPEVIDRANAMVAESMPLVSASVSTPTVFRESFGFSGRDEPGRRICSAPDERVDDVLSGNR